MAIEGLKIKITEASGVAFQEKTFQQSDGEFHRNHSQKKTNTSETEIQALVINVQKVQQESMKESQETNAYLVELMTEIAQSNRPPSRMGKYISSEVIGLS